MQTTPFRSTFAFFIIAILSIMVSNAQVIRFTINLPASFEVNDVSNSPLVLEPMSDNQSFTLKENLRWIEFRSQENTEMIIEMQIDRKKGMGNTKAYYLNDGTTNFAAAPEVDLNGSVLSMYKYKKTIEQITGQSKFLSSWLGIPARQGGLLTIIYL